MLDSFKINDIGKYLIEEEIEIIDPNENDRMLKSKFDLQSSSKIKGQ
jgi:hypothetical protein